MSQCSVFFSLLPNMEYNFYFILKQKGKKIENNINCGQYNLILNSVQYLIWNVVLKPVM